MMHDPMNEEEAVKAEGNTTDNQDGNAADTFGEDAGQPADGEVASDGLDGDDPHAAAEEGADPDEWKDKYLRLYAEFDNFRKRTMRERGELVRSAGREVMEALLPVLDDFERARAAAGSQDVEQEREGYALIGQKMRGVLEARGLQRMEAKGAAFDTDLHEAITQIPAPEEALKGKVVDVVEPGYKLHDTVLRFAKVVVGN